MCYQTDFAQPQNRPSFFRTETVERMRLFRLLIEKSTATWVSALHIWMLVVVVGLRAGKFTRLLTNVHTVHPVSITFSCSFLLISSKKSKKTTEGTAKTSGFFSTIPRRNGKSSLLCYRSLWGTLPFPVENTRGNTKEIALLLP